jgi:hypothetical protein
VALQVDGFLSTDCGQQQLPRGCRSADDPRTSINRQKTGFEGRLLVHAKKRGEITRRFLSIAPGFFRPLRNISYHASNFPCRFRMCRRTAKMADFEIGDSAASPNVNNKK